MATTMTEGQYHVEQQQQHISCGDNGNDRRGIAATVVLR